ncbi:E3 ubiquitin-protein ligase rnf12-B [Hordeum vulgare]|nr:E3 ubiquitin-protein ligase rnf12-B [Hordeum vulgare]
MDRPQLTIVAPEYVVDVDDLVIEARSAGRQRTAFFGTGYNSPHEGAGCLFSAAASSRAIQGLHAPAVGETRELGCAVCLDDFKDGDELRSMPCSHSFHQRCIFRWLQISRLCPYCRFALPSVHEQRVPDLDLDLDEQAAQAGSGSEASDR